MSKTIETIPEATMEALKRWKWPGNIRELENFLERAGISVGRVGRARPPRRPPSRGESKAACARVPATRSGALYLDLEAREDREKLLEPILSFRQYEEHLVVLDEIHRAPELFCLMFGGRLRP